MKITFYGHACFGVEMNGKNLLFDPFITPNKKAKEIDINNIKADYILISHAHGDHIADVEAITKNTGAQIISNFEIVNWFSEKGIEGHGMNFGGFYSFDFAKVKMCSAIHSSSFPNGDYGGNPGGFIIQGDDSCFYYSGDTALTYDMKLFGEMNDFDFAFLPIGSNFTMGIEEAVKASQFIQCDNIIGMHFDTFPPITIDKQEAKNAFEAKGKNLKLIEIGASINI